MRQTAGYLPTAEVAFVDEIFKANSAILNALLTILNERLFDNGNQRLQAPLLCLVGASNELPESEELDALYDRFLVRRTVAQVGGGARAGQGLGARYGLQAGRTVSWARRAGAGGQGSGHRVTGGRLAQAGGRRRRGQPAPRSWPAPAPHLSPASSPARPQVSNAQLHKLARLASGRGLTDPAPANGNGAAAAAAPAGPTLKIDDFRAAPDAAYAAVDVPDGVIDLLTSVRGCGGRCAPLLGLVLVVV